MAFRPERTWLQRRVPQCPMYGMVRKTDYATPGAARERVDPAHRGVQRAVSGCCEVRVKNSSRALNLQIQPAAFSARGH